MVEENDVKKIKRCKPMSKRPMGRPKKRREDDVLEGIKSMNVCSWKNVAQDRDRWKKVFEQARTVNRLWCFIRRRRRRYNILFFKKIRNNMKEENSYFFFISKFIHLFHYCLLFTEMFSLILVINSCCGVT